METPADWPEAQLATEHAIGVVRGVLSDRSGVLASQIVRYYRPDDRFAGNTFLDLGPNEPTRLTPTDLYAVSLLNVTVHPRGARKLMDASVAEETTALLDRIPEAARLQDASADVVATASELHRLIRRTLGTNPWVMASKLTARKRPELFPIRDRVVTQKGLGLAKDFQIDWQVYSALLVDADVTERLADLRAATERGGVTISDPNLKFLDAVLWVHFAGVRA